MIKTKSIKQLTKYQKSAQKQLGKVLKFIKANKIQSALTAALLILVILLAFPFRFLVIPAMVNNKPIFSWEYFSALHQNAGQQVINQLISEKLVQQEVKKHGIIITDSEIDAQIAQIEAQFGEDGSLDTVLALQGMTRSQFIKQMRLNLALEKLVAGTIEVTQEEIDQELTTNSELYQELSPEEAATTAAQNLRSDKLQPAFAAWFDDIKAEAKIKNFIAPAAVPAF